MTKVAVKLEHEAALTTPEAEELPPGQAHWWLRKDSEFIRLPKRVRGDSDLDLVVQLDPGTYVLGVGPARGGVREEIVVAGTLAKGTGETASPAPAGTLDLAGKTVVITGDLDGLDRDAAKAWLVSLGAKVTSAVSKQTHYLIVGRDPGQKKLEKAAELGTTVLTEAELRAQLGGAAPAPVEVVEPAKVDRLKRLMTKLSNLEYIAAKVEAIVGPSHFADLGMHEHELWGIAIGPRGGHYNVYIDLNDRPNWAIRCSCRERNPCKHGYALLLTADRHFVPPVPPPPGHEEASRYIPNWE